MHELVGRPRQNILPLAQAIKLPEDSISLEWVWGMCECGYTHTYTHTHIYMCVYVERRDRKRRTGTDIWVLKDHYSYIYSLESDFPLSSDQLFSRTTVSSSWDLTSRASASGSTVFWVRHKLLTICGGGAGPGEKGTLPHIFMISPRGWKLSSHALFTNKDIVK